jgi:hypothetical protein
MRHRVLLRHPAGSGGRGSVDALSEGYESAERRGLDALVDFYAKCERERRREIHPIVCLGKEGPDWGRPPRDGDEIGYGMHPFRTDDCLRAAIATVTQIPIEQVPDLGLDDCVRRGEDPEEISVNSWGRIEDWAASS